MTNTQDHTASRPATLYVVVPCFNEEPVLEQTVDRLGAVLARLIEGATASVDSRLLMVDDGSTDGTWALIDRFARDRNDLCAIKLAANSGHQNALLAGIEVAATRADAIVTIDADLQDDPEAIALMWHHFCADGADVVYGVRNDRTSDTWFKRTSAQAFYRIMQHLGVKTVYNHADFRLLSSRAAKALLRFRERNLFLRGMVPLVGYRSAIVTYDRRPRLAGDSKYPLTKMVGFAVDGITSFSIRPVRLVSGLGLVFLVIALCMLVYVLVAYFRGNVVSGWASLILSIWFVGGCILLGLGIVGEYIGKIYIEVKDRPRYEVETIIIH